MSVQPTEATPYEIDNHRALYPTCYGRLSAAVEMMLERLEGSAAPAAVVDELDQLRTTLARCEATTKAPLK